MSCSPITTGAAKDGTFEAFPTLDEKALVVEEDGNAWVVTRAALHGYGIQARVAKDGSLVDLVFVGHSTH